MALSSAQEAMEATGYSIEAMAVRAIDPWGGVGLARLQNHLTGSNSSPPPITCAPVKRRSA
jgi:hypothetical protein